jgi:hypothetical protein
MNTPTHLLASAVVLAKPGDTKRNGWILFGALLPDLSMFVMFIWARVLMRVPQQEIWSDVYFDPFWQTVSNIANAAPLYALALAIGAALKLPLLYVFSFSALLHIALDLPVHREDAHAHFWPITDWKFISPVSYWDPDHFGLWSTGFELVLAAALIVVLWRRFSSRGVRIALGVAFAAYFVAPAYFIFALGI